MIPPTLTCSSRRRGGTPLTLAQETTKGMKRKRADTQPVARRPPKVSVASTQLGQQVTMEMLTELLHFAVLGTSNGAQQPSWCHLHRQKNIRGLNVVVLDGLTQCVFYKHFLTLEHLRTNYKTRLTFTPSATSLPSGIFSSTVPQSVSLCFAQRDQESNQLSNELRLHPVIRKFGTKVKGLTAYILTREEMMKKNFPVRGVRGFEDFVSTQSVDCVTDGSPLYGLDCEMCLTEKGYELARVSLVDSSGVCVLDALVRPPNPILNYLTRFSGITAAMLQPISTTVGDVQVELLRLLPADAVLVGHSLDNDLRALRLIHPHVIDTSLLYRREFGQRFKLRVLAEAVLGKQIQTEEQRGHDPAEDASAALGLAQYFIKEGPRLVVERHIPELWGPALRAPPAVQPPPSSRFADVLQRSGKSVTFIGKRTDITINPSNQQWHSSDKEVLASFRRQAAGLCCSVVQFSSFSDHMKRSGLQPEHHQHASRAHLRRMCVVFAGPLPPGLGVRDVKRLFRCCGAVERIRMLPTSHRTHAEIEFRLLEGALLAVRTLSGRRVNGQRIQVQRPVSESTLDLDLTLEALKEDSLSVNQVHVTGLCPDASALPTRPHASGPKPPGSRLEEEDSEPEENGTETMETPSSKTTDSLGHQPLGGPAACRPSEEDLRDAFGHFGEVENILLPVEANGRRARHARIKFQSPCAAAAALGSAERLRERGFLICPSLTPAHLGSWAPGTRTQSDAEWGGSVEGCTWNGEMERVMKRLDQRLRKLYKSLPDHTLSVVVLPGQTSLNGQFPGLCFMEVKTSLS